LTEVLYVHKIFTAVEFYLRFLQGFEVVAGDMTERIK